MAFDGGCLCGAIRYEARGEPRRVFVCHCRDCRKSGGSAFHLGVVFAGSDFVLVQGKPTAYAHHSDSGRKVVRHFCPNCGSGIYNEPEVVPDDVVVKGGTLDDPSSVAPSYELYARSKPEWLELTSVETSFEAMRP